MLVFEMPKANAEKCKQYRERNKLEIKEKTSERVRPYRLRQKITLQENESFVTPSVLLNSDMCVVTPGPLLPPVSSSIQETMSNNIANQDDDNECNASSSAHNSCNVITVQAEIHMQNSPMLGNRINMKSIPMTSTERSRRCRERKKQLIDALTIEVISSQDIVLDQKDVPLSSTERSRRYRERKKHLSDGSSINEISNPDIVLEQKRVTLSGTERSRRYRDRRKEQLDVSSVETTSDQGNVMNHNVPQSNRQGLHSNHTERLEIKLLKSAESEEIEIVPDIHIPDESSSVLDCDTVIENEYIGVKLKNFSNIHYQVISTPALKLTDVHMILYLTTSAQNNIRKNILEFSGFPFDETSSEYQCRRGLMEQLSIEDLKAVATVLCVSQYIVDESRNSLIEAILKFLLKPSALLNSSTIMPTISPVPVPRLPVKKKATSSTGKVSHHTSSEVVVSDLPSGIIISKVESVASSVNHCTMTIKKEERKPELKKLQACFSSSDIEIVPLPMHRESSMRESACSSIEIVPLPIKREKRKVSKEESFAGESLLADMKVTPTSELHTTKEETCRKDLSPSHSTPLHIKSETCLSSGKLSPSSPPKRSPADVDEPLLDVKKSARVVQYLGSDEDDDQPLSKMIGHPNDDQLRALVVKIMKESKLEDVTMKHVICRVFETYPNYDLGYRKEFIKSIVRQILSQMENPNCSVSTTVINI